MTKKEWLSSGIGIQSELRALLQARAQTVYDAQQAKEELSVDTTQLCERLAAFERRLTERIDTLYATKQEIEAAIGKISDRRYRAVLTERYINSKKWEQIAEEMKYSAHYVSDDLHSAALNALQYP